MTLRNHLDEVDLKILNTLVAVIFGNRLKSGTPQTLMMIFWQNSKNIKFCRFFVVWFNAYEAAGDVVHADKKRRQRIDFNAIINDSLF